jgi:predicted amidohydrolase
MTADIVLKGGRVIDPGRNINGLADVFITGRKIAEILKGETVQSECTIDVQDCIVVPGLIDFHTHVYECGTDSGVPDSIFPSMGVTTIGDAGSAGSANFEAFYRDLVARSSIRIKSFLNISPTGIITRKYHENVDPRFFDLPKIERIFEKYSQNIVGLKIRVSRNIVGDLGIKPLRATLDLADKLGCPVVVHVTDPCVPTAELANVLRKGDVFCHVYHGTGSTIIGDDGKVLEAVREARRRGVFFDSSNGRTNFANKTAFAAIADGFLPDIISTDAGMLNVFRGLAFGLPYIMSKYINMGVDLVDVIRACTSTPAALLKMDGQIGTLAPGSCADVTVLQLKQKRTIFTDINNETMIGSKILVPQLTICDGNILFRQMDI